MQPLPGRGEQQRHMRQLWWAYAGFGVGFGAAAVTGLVRTLLDGLALDEDQAQWSHVAEHEQRFLQALSAGTAWEGDDAG